VLYVHINDYRKQNFFLLAASYGFYAAFSPWFLLILLVSSLVDYFLGQGIMEGMDSRRRKLILATSLTLNLTVLGLFKYFNFFVQNGAEMVRLLGLKAHVATLQIILPVGISYYTFQKIGYIVDIYRGKIRPLKSITSFLLYISFFPKLLSGPIENAVHFLPQILNPRMIKKEDVRIGLLYMVTGYFSKVVLADSLAPMVDRVFDYPDQVTGITVLFGILCYSLQIYGDFAGYSLMAQGLSRLMGFDLIRNFKTPYFSINPREFWNRWHISLSLFLRDYVYIPLGGNQKSETMTCFNLMVTMSLAGLWHGAGWNYFLWGAYHGVLLCVSRLLHLSKSSLNRITLPVVLQMSTTFFLISAGWLIFRAQRMVDVRVLIARIFTDFSWDYETSLYLKALAPICVLLFAYDYLQWKSKDDQVLLKSSALVKNLAYSFMAISIAAVGFRQMPFIYFQF